MNLSEKTIEALCYIINGDSSPITGAKQISPYRKGADLVSFFNQFGLDDTYNIDFRSNGHYRLSYTKEKLCQFNAKPTMKDILVMVVDPRHFLGTEFDINVVVTYLNKFLEFDNYELRFVGKKWEVYQLNTSQIELSHPYENSIEITHIFIDEQIEKCENKLAIGDFDGAITNARSLVEAVLLSIEKEFDPDQPKYDGEFQKLYKRVQKYLNLSPEKNIEQCLNTILSGLIKIIDGLATLRNNMSDAHPISYKPSEHHAKLAVNSAKTLCNFLFDTKEYQIKKDKNN